MELEMIVDRSDNDTMDVRFIHPDGRELSLFGTVTPEMDMDEFEWAWAECQAGRGGDYGYKIDGYSLPPTLGDAVMVNSSNRKQRLNRHKRQL